MSYMAEKIKKFLKYYKLYALIFGPFILAGLFLFSTRKEVRCAYIISVMVLYWATDAIPVSVTALMPVFAFPLLGIMSSTDTCHAYMHEMNMLLLGGLIVSLSVEFCDLHKRIGLYMILHIGQSPRKLLLGVLMATTWLSMLITNVPAAAVMLPIVDEILKLLKTLEMKDLDYISIDRRMSKQNAAKEEESKAKYTPEKSLAQYGEYIYNPEEVKIFFMGTNDDKVKEKISGKKEETSDAVNFKAMKTMFYLAVICASNMGGPVSLTASTPELFLKGVQDSYFNRPTGLNFETWMGFNIPGMILNVLSTFIWLQLYFVGFGSRSTLPKTTKEKREKLRHIIKDEYNKLGETTFHEYMVIIIYVTLVIFWLFRDPGFMTGWSDFVRTYFPNIILGDGVPVIVAILFLFVIPSHANFWPSAKYKDEPSQGCMIWSFVHERVPWDGILLLGGAFAIAEGSLNSGFAIFMAEKLKFIESFPVSISILVISIMTTFATEFVPSTVSVSILIPVLKELALRMCVNPLYLMVPGAVSCSFTFTSPIATSANVFVYGYADGDMKLSDMLKAGCVVNIMCAVIVNILINTIGVAMFNVWELPTWINHSNSTGEFAHRCFETEIVSF